MGAREQTCSGAPLEGQLSVLRWARPNGCPWSESTCSAAAVGGHLEVLQWVRANGCPLNEKKRLFAAEQGHLDVLRWARSSGCPWDERTCSSAAGGGHLTVLQCAYENGCPVDEETCTRWLLREASQQFFTGRGRTAVRNTGPCKLAASSGARRRVSMAEGCCLSHERLNTEMRYQ